MRYFSLENSGNSSEESRVAMPPDRPLRALFLTSVRDIGRGSDNCGESVVVDGQRVYMRGLIEAVVDAIHAGDPIADHLEVAGVVYDDTARDLRRDGYPISPLSSSNWIYPLDRMTRPINGEPLGDITHHVPSNFRRLPRKDLVGRQELKAEFEATVVELMRSTDADIIVSDHLLMRIESLIDDQVHNLSGRVLNIHPAITHADHPRTLRGLTPTQDAIDRANGFSRDRKGVVRPVVPYGRTGATLHFVAPEIDAGSVICDDEPTPVYGDDEPQALRERNYRLAKIPVFVAGMIHYYHNMFARLLADNSSIITTLNHESLNSAA